MKRMRGVTLMELMIVVAIVGILASVAYPSYMEQARRGRRASAQAMLYQVLAREERFYSENNTYTTNLASLGFPATTYSEHNTHTISLAAGPTGIATSVIVSATPTAADTKCDVLTLSNAMAKDATGTDPTICW